MSRNPLQQLDLSGLPPEVRAKIEKRLASMSPEVQAKWAAGGAPLLARLVNGLSAAGNSEPVPPPLPGSRPDAGASHAHPAKYHSSAPVDPGRRKPQGHYNDTVRPGDAPGTSARILLAGLALAAAAWLLF